jgi:cytochrome P450
MVGTDSTATAVRCIFYYIVTNPRVYAALQRELDQALANGDLHRPILRDAEARKLPYLQACITEGLRIWPPVAALAYKKVPAEGERLEDGRFVPAGTNIGISTWAVHHSAAMYGPDADVYRPERWLEAKGEKLLAMNRCMELIFGGGRYTCLGKTIAFLELNKAIAEVSSFQNS